MTIERVTLIGIGFTFVVAVVNLYFTIRNDKQNRFINSVTSSRIQYIQDLRTSISQFCGIIYSYNLRLDGVTKLQLFEIQREADKLKYLIKLYLNPEDKYWDEKIISLIDQILELSDKNPKDKIDELIYVTQYLLKLEWEGAKKESEKGMLTNLEKRDLYNQYVELHKNQTSKGSKH